jgi:hypothetical protein
MMKLDSMINDEQMKKLFSDTMAIRKRRFTVINRLYDGFAEARELHEADAELVQAERRLWKHVRDSSKHLA